MDAVLLKNIKVIRKLNIQNRKEYNQHVKNASTFCAKAVFTDETKNIGENTIQSYIDKI